MARYHVNPATGDCNICRAQPGNCRFGEENHYPSMGEAQDASEQLIEGDATGAAQSMVKGNASGVNQPPAQAYHNILTDAQREQLEKAIKNDPQRFYIHEFPADFNRHGEQLYDKQVLMFKHHSPDDEAIKIDHIYMQFADEDYPDDGTSIAHFLDRFNELYSNGQYRFDDVLGESSDLYEDDAKGLKRNGWFNDEKYEFDAEEWNSELDKVSALARQVSQNDPSMKDLCREVLRMTDDVRAEAVYDWRALPTAHVSMTDDDYQGYCEDFAGTQLYDEDEYDEDELEERIDDGGMLASDFHMGKNTVMAPLDCLYGVKLDEYKPGIDCWSYDYQNDFTDPKLGNYWQQEDRLEEAARRYGIPVPKKGWAGALEEHPTCTPDRWNIYMDLIIQEAEADRYREMIRTRNTTESDDIIRRANLLKITEVYASSDLENYCPSEKAWNEWKNICEDYGVLYE